MGNRATRNAADGSFSIPAGVRNLGGIITVDSDTTGAMGKGLFV